MLIRNTGMKTYLFLDNDVYAPETQTDVFGFEVEIIKRKGDEVWFAFKQTGKNGYVIL